MLYPSIEEVRKRTDSRYTLCILAAKRARDLIDGKPPLVDVSELSSERPVSIAAKEIADYMVSYKTKEQAEAEAAAAEARAEENLFEVEEASDDFIIE